MARPLPRRTTYGRLPALTPPSSTIPLPDRPALAVPRSGPRTAHRPHQLTNLLNRHGISACPARNGALAALASDLPAAILADLLGLHINTAVRWVTYARKDWTDYLAERTAEQKEAGR
ncbi:hypothetical protein GCM10010176_104080 [Nonomuraea spiralis]|nr:hypothetical protein GCM10010176_104080 [Nonomuraea spiralis]